MPRQAGRTVAGGPSECVRQRAKAALHQGLGPRRRCGPSVVSAVLPALTFWNDVDECCVMKAPACLQGFTGAA